MTDSATAEIPLHPDSRAALAADPEFQHPAFRSLISGLAEDAPEEGFSGPADRRIPRLDDSDIALICRLRKEAVIDEMGYAPLIDGVANALHWPREITGLARDLLQKACLRAIWIDITVRCEQRRQEVEANR